MQELFDRIQQIPFPTNQYFQTVYAKTQVFLHHTVSGAKAIDVFNYWASNKEEVATCCVVDRSGTICQGFSSKYWAYHLGVRNEDLIAAKVKTYKRLDFTSIGIEIDSWGGLVKHTDKKWYPCYWDKTKRKLMPYVAAGPVANVIEYKNGYRGFYAFEKYTDEQIKSVKLLLQYWNQVYNIPLTYNPTMFDISSDAIQGKPGIWSHTSVRTDKSDIHPQPEMIEMLKSLV